MGRLIRVLLVEDNAIIREALKTIVQAFPSTVLVGEATTGEQAIKSAESLRPDIVLMDINIPVLDGIATTRMIKQRHPAIAVIGLTAGTPEYLIYAMKKAGAFDVLSKDKALTLHELMQRAVDSAMPAFPHCSGIDVSSAARPKTDTN